MLPEVGWCTRARHLCDPEAGLVDVAGNKEAHARWVITKRDVIDTAATGGPQVLVHNLERDKVVTKKGVDRGIGKRQLAACQLCVEDIVLNKAVAIEGEGAALRHAVCLHGDNEGVYTEWRLPFVAEDEGGEVDDNTGRDIALEKRDG